MKSFTPGALKTDRASPSSGHRLSASLSLSLSSGRSHPTDELARGVKWLSLERKRESMAPAALIQSQRMSQCIWFDEFQVRESDAAQAASLFLPCAEYSSTTVSPRIGIWSISEPRRRRSIRGFHGSLRGIARGRISPEDLESEDEHIEPLARNHRFISVNKARSPHSTRDAATKRESDGCAPGKAREWYPESKGADARRAQRHFPSRTGIRIRGLGRKRDSEMSKPRRGGAPAPAQAGFGVVEIHSRTEYLLHEFLLAALESARDKLWRFI